MLKNIPSILSPDLLKILMEIFRLQVWQNVWCVLTVTEFLRS
jgi:hypothetical protein